MIPVRQQWPEEFAARYRQKNYWRGETMSGFLRERAQQLPDHVAVVSGDSRWTYSELYNRACRVAAGLMTLGLQPGERVVVQLPNIAEFFSVVFGCIRAGLIPVFTLPAHRAAEIRHFVQQAEASAYVIPGVFEGFDYRSIATQVQSEMPELRHVIVTSGDAGSFIPLSALETPSAAEVSFPEASPSDVFMMQLSGGSTGLSSHS
jgi:2,3-dihydroxybenzoate-AMP ligase